jgi:hypothetical protein
MRPHPEYRLASGSTPDGWRLQVVLSWTGDRYEQRIEVGHPDGARHATWQTHEGTTDSEWPTSPPIQQLHVQETRSGSSVVLGVGMAGSSHWSMSLEADAADAVLIWDVACRCAASYGPLQSGFVQCDPSAGTAVGEPVAAVRLQPEPLAAAGVELCRMQATPGRVVFIPHAAPQRATPGTIRWRFAWRLRS